MWHDCIVLLVAYEALDISWTWVMVRFFSQCKVFWCLRGVPPFVRKLDHFGDLYTHCLTSLKLWRHWTESVGNLVSLEGNKVTLNIGDMNHMLSFPATASLHLSSFGLVSWGLYEAMSTGFAKICHCTSLSSFLYSLTNRGSSRPSWKKRAHYAWVLQAVVWVWTWDTSWSAPVRNSWSWHVQAMGRWRGRGYVDPWREHSRIVLRGCHPLCQSHSWCHYQCQC